MSKESSQIIQRGLSGLCVVSLILAWWTVRGPALWLFSGGLGSLLLSQLLIRMDKRLARNL